MSNISTSRFLVVLATIAAATGASGRITASEGRVTSKGDEFARRLDEDAGTVTPCSNGLPGVELGDVCCPESCGTCGGVGCSSRPGGAYECCTSDIKSLGLKCGDTGAAPCLMDGTFKGGCDPNPCLNGGSCSSSGDEYMCSCAIGYGGTDCETDTFTDFTGKQLEVLAGELSELGTFTDYTDTDGVWETVKDNGNIIDKTVWTSGMVAGMYWYQYELTGNATWAEKAEFFCEGLEGVEELDDNDLGFQARDAGMSTFSCLKGRVLNSYGLGYRLSSSSSLRDAYKQRVLTGAQSLYDFRWTANIPAFWSWENPSSRPEWERAVNVDMIMNMEIMLWASVNGGDPTYAENVVDHADTTWKDIVRDDNSTFHVADYDPDTGDLVEQGTYQGYADNTTWTRGQAWAIYGYVMIYRYLQEPKFLERSLACLKYFDDNLPSDGVPPADFDAPVNATDNGKDSSSTAIVASALFEIYTETGDSKYLAWAEKYLSAVLTADYYLPDATDGYQSILRRATSRWGETERGAVFGDYFVLEAMV
ncbi:unnamed protein product, partial [Ascophyllum nodosum]